MSLNLNDKNRTGSHCFSTVVTLSAMLLCICDIIHAYTIIIRYRLVAGDKCIPGNETYFLRQFRPCPIKGPRGLYIIPNSPFVEVGGNVQFTLTQLLVSPDLLHSESVIVQSLMHYYSNLKH